MKRVKPFNKFTFLKCEICGEKCEINFLNNKIAKLCEKHLLKETRKLKLEQIGKA